MRYIQEQGSCNAHTCYKSEDCKMQIKQISVIALYFEIFLIMMLRWNKKSNHLCKDGEEHETCNKILKKWLTRVHRIQPTRPFCHSIQSPQSYQSLILPHLRELKLSLHWFLKIIINIINKNLISKVQNQNEKTTSFRVYKLNKCFSSTCPFVPKERLLSGKTNLF